MTEERLPNGLQVIWVPDKEQHGMTVALQIPAGEFSDPESFEGTAELTVNLMQKGTQSLTPEEFAQKLEQTGASFFADTGDEQIVLGCKMLSKVAGSILPLFWEMLCCPRFDNDELFRLKREMMTALQAEFSDPNALANKHFYSLLCGNAHPAGRLHTVMSIKHISLSHVKKFYSDHFSSMGSLLVVAGDFDMDEAARRWRGLFSTWKASSPAKACVAEALAPMTTTKLRLVDKPDISQTYFMLGHPVPGELYADRNALALANYILGGGNFSSRLMANVRSSKGKTYGISSQTACNRNCGIFMISTATLSAQTAEVLKAILTVYQDFASNGVTDEELEKAKQFVIGNMAFQLEGIGNITEKLLWLRLYGRDNAYIERFDALIAAIDKNMVNEVIRKHVSSKHFALVAVGRKKEVLPQLESFGDVVTMHFRANPR
jgi:Predicted Zn-dependent peptidases